jgi:murein DD-endopeptidase MepM/ murein hydrolase activator NlpD
MRRRKPRASKPAAKDHKGVWSSSLRSAVVVVVGAFMATVSLPSTGFNLAAPGFAAQSDDGLQVVTASDTTDTATAIKRDGYKVSSYGDLYGLRFGSLSYTYTVLNTGPIRWPFPAAVPISSGYGHRQAPCATCSSDHKGLDFNPGAGSPIYAIADGVVVESNNDRGGFGRWIVIRHDVNGLQFDSVYAHMQRDSVTLNIGDTVAVTDYVGRVGSTGMSTGAHLHLEIHVNGVQVDPFTWLKANTAQ